MIVGRRYAVNRAVGLSWLARSSDLGLVYTFIQLVCEKPLEPTNHKSVLSRGLHFGYTMLKLNI